MNHDCVASDTTAQLKSDGEADDFVPKKITLKNGQRRGLPVRSDIEAGNCENDVAGGSAGKQSVEDPPALQTSPDISPSVVFHEECELFDELDDIYPHAREGGDAVSDPRSSSANTFARSCSESHRHSSGRSRSDSNLSASRSFTQSLLQSLQNSSLGDRLPDYDSLLASSNAGTLAQMIAGIEERHRASEITTQANRKSVESNDGGNIIMKRESIVGGERISDMPFEEQRKLLAPERPSNCLVIDVEENGTMPEKWKGLQKEGNSDGFKRAVCSYSPTISSNVENVIVSSVDWSSLSKSCKRAKNAFRDAESGQVVVKNMFMTHFAALNTVLTLFSRGNCDSNKGVDGMDRCSIDEIKSRTTETKRALRFAMSCLAPPHGEESSLVSVKGQSGVDPYQIARQFRQEMQEATVKGTPRASSPSQEDEIQHSYGLHVPLVKIIGTDPNLRASGDEDACPNEMKITASIKQEQRTVRILAARMLCNLVTDNKLAAEAVLSDVPFSPTPDQIESRMARSILDSTEQVDVVAPIGNEIISWSDLVAATGQLQTINGSGSKRGLNDQQDREALAAVAAALHNLLSSLETREISSNEKQRQESSRGNSPVSARSIDEESEVGQKSMEVDVGFDVACNGHLLRNMLRHILPADGVLMLAKHEREHIDDSRPKFRPPQTATSNVSDSATEWITLVLERLASCGLLPQMLRSVGSTVVTPEKVVLVSCIRQAVDDYHSAGGFGHGPLSTAAKAAGTTTATRPHPLWGRADDGAGGMLTPGRVSRTAVPVMISLANEVEEFRLRANALRESKSTESYDGEQNCTSHIIVDIFDIISQSLGRHASHGKGSKQCHLADARSVLGRETSILSSCLKDLARVLDRSLKRNSGRKARELTMSSQEQATAIVMVRLVGNLIYQCRYNQDMLRTTLVPSTDSSGSLERTGLHVILSATSLAPACFTLREWCIVAIRNAVEGNDANAETVRRLEANQVIGDTPELQRMGVKIEMDSEGKVHVKRT
ncbi:hypothetical protein ACHAWF_008698 [Thalassiosira exigua]